MLKFLTKILNTGLDSDENRDEKEPVEIATAVFLLEIAHADSKVHPLEEAAVRDGLQALFKKSASQVDSMLESARQAREKSFDLYQFAKEINGHFQTEEKTVILENIWRVVYADGVLDKYEEALVRKIAKLLRLSHREMIQVKLKVLDKEADSLPDRSDDGQGT